MFSQAELFAKALLKEAVKQAAYTIKRHCKGVLNWVRSRISNGILEGFNSVFQAAKTKTRG